MNRRRKILVVLGALAVVIGGGLLYARPLLLTGTGYAAHNACAVTFVAGRPAEAAADDLPDNPLVPVLGVGVDERAGTARASVFGLFSQTAHHVDGLGCVLADEVPEVATPTVVTVPADQEWPTGNEVVPPPSTVDTAALDAAIDNAFAEDDPQGRAVGTRAVVVVHDGGIVAERYAEGFTADTPQLGWSMAKSVTNAMVGRLVADGSIAVDDAQLRPEWTDERADITLDDMLRMASGLEWDEEYALGSTITAMLYLEEDMGAFAAAQPLAAEPGTVQQYSSGTTNIVCDVLSEASGLGADMAHVLVFDPLGMSSAVLEPDAAGGLVCSSYLWATPRDWARFGLWFAQGGQWDGQQLLPADWIDYSTSTVPLDGEDEGHAVHWWVNHTADGTPVLDGVPDDAYWASGHDGQRVFVVPSADLVVVRMGFTPDIPSAELGHDDLLTGVLAAVGE